MLDVQTMSGIVIGYGKYRGYRLAEIPQQLLDELAARFPLRVTEHSTAEYAELLVTIAIHEELSRRANGGQPKRHPPSVRQCASDIIGRGFQQASKDHHPDGKGDHEAQLRLTRARDLLRRTIDSFPDEIDAYSQTLIPEPGQPVRGPSTIRDDDVPF
jgi:hypothetical protein